MPETEQQLFACSIGGTEERGRGRSRSTSWGSGRGRTMVVARAVDPKGVSLPFAGNILTIKLAAKVACNVKLTLH